MNNTFQNIVNPNSESDKRLLGQILIDGEFISIEDLEHALEKQKETNKLLGETLVQIGMLDPLDLKAVLSINKDLSNLHDAVKLAAGVRHLLGELLLRAKRITTQDLGSALQEQQQTGEKLGEILVRKGLINKNELNVLLTFQKYQDPEALKSEKLKLGELMVTSGLISRVQLEDALTKQKLSKKKIGDTLVEAGYIKPRHLSNMLKLQSKLITAVLVTTLSLASLSDTNAESIQKYDILKVKSTLAEESQTLTAMKVVFQRPELIVTDADIQRGYIDILAATKIEIQNNNLAGYLVIFEGFSSTFKEVIVKGFGKEVLIGSQGGWIAQPYNGRDPLLVELSYRFILSENAKPGKYVWPLNISASPVIPV